MTVDEEETMIPINDVKANPIGIVRSCDQKADFGVLAKREKSGSLLYGRGPAHIRTLSQNDSYRTHTISVAKLAIDDKIPLTIAQPSSLPCKVFF